MTDRNLRTLVAALAGLLVVVVAITLLILVGRGGPGTASATPPGSPVASATSAASASASPSAPAGATASTAPSASVAPSLAGSASLTPTSSPLPAPLATMTFLGLKLDATADAAGEPRIVTFRSDGPGTVTAKLASKTPQGTTHMCLRVGTKEVGCKDWASGTFTGKTTQAHATWQVTLRGNAIETPTVDLTVTFQALAPSVAIEHARFDGTAYPETNGIQARFTARAPGATHLAGNWGGHPFLYEVDLFDETSGTGNATFPNQGPSTNVDQSIPVTAGVWRLVLQNVEAGFGTTDLTATLGWP
jgi:hypothetical protein